MGKTKSITEQELIEQCAAGNQLAQMQLYNQYSKAMFNVSMRILNNQDKAEDAMQEAFIMAFKKMNTFRGEVTIGAWIKRIVINKSIDLLKKKEENAFRLNEEIYAETVTDSSSNQEDEYQMQQVMNKIMNLPTNDRTIISLYYLEGYDHEEIAEILKISYANSRTKLSRALGKLKAMV